MFSVFTTVYCLGNAHWNHSTYIVEWVLRNRVGIESYKLQFRTGLCFRTGIVKFCNYELSQRWVTFRDSPLKMCSQEEDQIREGVWSLVPGKVEIPVLIWFTHSRSNNENCKLCKLCFPKKYSEWHHIHITSFVVYRIGMCFSIGGTGEHLHSTLQFRTGLCSTVNCHRDEWSFAKVSKKCVVVMRRIRYVKVCEFLRNPWQNRNPSSRLIHSSQEQQRKL